MSTQKINVLVPPLHPVPPGAAWIAAALFSLFGGDRAASWSERLDGARRRHAAERAARRDARSRYELIELARRYEGTQPSFAKDLMAAAGNDRRR